MCGVPGSVFVFLFVCFLSIVLGKEIFIKLEDRATLHPELSLEE